MTELSPDNALLQAVASLSGVVLTLVGTVEELQQTVDMLLLDFKDGRGCVRASVAWMAQCLPRMLTNLLSAVVWVRVSVNQFPLEDPNGDSEAERAAVARVAERLYTGRVMSALMSP